MSRPSNRGARGRAGRDYAEHRANLYDEVTRRIIAELEQGELPWKSTARSAACASPSLSCNALTGRGYSSINVLLLWDPVIIANVYPRSAA